MEFGEWSDKFSLDVPGSSGVVTCKNEGRTYQVCLLLIFMLTFFKFLKENIMVFIVIVSGGRNQPTDI